MAETPEKKDKKTEAKPGAKKKGGAKPDLATIAGLVVAVGGIVGGLLLEKGSIQDVAQATAAMIVMGGTFGAVLVTNPLPVFLRALKGMRYVFFEQASSAAETVEMLLQFAVKARKGGIVSLESDAAEIQDPFLRKALNLAVDGTDLNQLRKMMETDIDLREQAGEAEAKVWEAAGGYAPTVGIIGAVMGLIQVMKNLEDIKEVGHGIAVAFVATIYGVASANLLFLPAANKLKTRVHHARLIMEMTLEGVVGIIEGLNPTLIRMQLESFNVEPAEPKKSKKAKDAKAAKGAERPAAAAQPASAGS